MEPARLIAAITRARDALNALTDVEPHELDLAKGIAQNEARLLTDLLKELQP